MSKKTIEEILKDLKKTDDYKEYKKYCKEQYTDEERNEIIKEFQEHVKEGIEEPCKISFDKGKDGITHIKTKCKTRIALLVTLVGAVESIKNEQHISQFEWDFMDYVLGFDEINKK